MTNDDFHTRYRLLQPVTEGKVETHHAVARTGAVVMVHFVSHGEDEERRELLSLVEALDPAERRRVLEVSEVEGRTAIVTRFIMDFHSLRGWLESEAARVAPPPPSQNPAAGTSSADPEPEPAPDAPGEFTRLFQASLITPTPPPEESPVEEPLRADPLAEPTAASAELEQEPEIAAAQETAAPAAATPPGELTALFEKQPAESTVEPETPAPALPAAPADIANDLDPLFAVPAAADDFQPVEGDTILPPSGDPAADASSFEAKEEPGGERPPAEEPDDARPVESPAAWDAADPEAAALWSDLLDPVARAPAERAPEPPPQAEPATPSLAAGADGDPDTLPETPPPPTPREAAPPTHPSAAPPIAPPPGERAAAPTVRPPEPTALPEWSEPAPPTPAAAPGELSQLFQRLQSPGTPAPGDPQPAPPKPSPFAPPPAPGESPGQPGVSYGESYLDRLHRSTPLGSGATPPLPPSPPPPAPEPPLFGNMGWSTPPLPPETAPPPQPQANVPSEYTRVISALPPESPHLAPPAAPVPSPLPPAPAESAPVGSAPVGSAPSRLPLVLGLGFVLLAALALLLYFLLRSG
ncbi:hypothetical protein BH23GEM7_BH23GEM7_11860 [soil metagenome]